MHFRKTGCHLNGKIIMDPIPILCKQIIPCLKSLTVWIMQRQTGHDTHQNANDNYIWNRFWGLWGNKGKVEEGKLVIIGYK